KVISTFYATHKRERTIQQVRIREGQTVKEALEKYRGNRLVAHAQRNYLFHLQTALPLPNDTHFGELWGLHNTAHDADIDAPEAWGITTGSADVIIAVIDTGVNYNHPELASNMWVNPGEIAGDGVDNDGNGFIDDIYGWDFGYSDSSPMDIHGHGTHVAGTVGAQGNNAVGITGVMWDAQIMALQAFHICPTSGRPLTRTNDLVNSISYATANGAHIINASWGGGGGSDVPGDILRDAIEAAGHNGVLFVAAAGNGGLDGIGDNNDTTPIFPASYSLDNIISVAATDQHDNLAVFSNFGATSVDVAAPGVNILSTVLANNYGFKRGTSMAAPHVAGLAGLLLSHSPNLTVAQLKALILDGVDPQTGLAGKMVSGGRINAYGSLTIPTVVITSTAPDPTNTSPIPMTATFSEAVTGFVEAEITVTNGEVTASSFTPVTGGKVYNFTVTPTADGLVSVDIPAGVANDTAGNPNAAAPQFSITFDSTIPLVTIDSVTTPTNTTTQAISGTMEAGATVDLSSITADVTFTGFTQDTTAGTWSATINLVEGTNDITATATDVAGNEGTATDTIVLDTIAPLVPTAVAVTNNVINIANLTTVEITGTAEADSTVEARLTDATSPTPIIVTATGTADSAGAFIITLNATTLIDGPISVDAKATDVARNIGPWSTPISVTKDTAAPTITIDSVTTPTNITTQTITGTVEAGATVAMSSTTGTSFGTVTVTGTTWSVVATLVEGTNNITATATDVDGNEGTATDTIVLDTIAPPAPSIPDLAAADDSGISDTDNITNLTTGLTFSGTAEVDSTVELFAGANSKGTVVATADNWSFDIALAAGTHSITVTAKDAAGNVSAASTALSVTIDTTAPVAPTAVAVTGNVINIANLTTVEVTGTAEADSTVEVRLTDAATPPVIVIATGTADATTGAFSITVNATTLIDGPILVDAKATDVAGNIGPWSTAISVTKDTAAPTITIDSVTTPTATTTQALTGTMEAGATVTLSSDTATFENVTPATTTWSVVATLAEGTNNITATATDVAGNEGTATDTIVLDTTAPAVSSIPADGARPRHFSVLTITMQDATGVDEAGTTITVTKDDEPFDAFARDNTIENQVTITINAPSDGEYIFTIIPKDTLGNIGTSTLIT
ncbi:MAG: S8 family serine peptidase, partial [Methanosarcinales archaeon]|nr:S8 family serine peptidase [Methanosarcinales archaeon]